MMDYSNISDDKIGAVIVLYNPNIPQLIKSLRVLEQSIGLLCLVDNSKENHEAELQYFKTVKYIPLMENRGIAAAQNVGVKTLKDLGVEYVVFSDQDSVADKATVTRLVSTYRQLRNMGINVGGVGTRAINVETGKPYRSKSKEYETISVGEGSETTKATRCSYIRSSISFIPITLFGEVGGFDESLFIDGVDNEWCWRANTIGCQFFIVENATITHHLGEGDHKIANRNVAISSTFRIYFQFRNYLWLCRRNYVPHWWKRTNLLKYAVKMVYYPLFVSPRTAFVKGIFKGILDGAIKNVKPKYEKI